ncbi:MAG: HAMP domain-containing protein [Prevotella sp.]|nr:HAMP domain-containing protein [Prevotella sp.]
MSEPVVKRTLSKRLSRTIMFLAVPLFVLSLGFFYQFTRDLLQKEAVERSHTILSTTVQLVENYLNAIETAAKSNAWMLEEHFNPDSLPALSHRLVRLNRSVLSCSVAAEPDAFPGYGESFSVYSVHDGDSVITSIEPEYEYFQKNWYKKPMQSGRPCWINPFSDFTEGVINHHDAVGSYCIPLRPHGDRIEGVVSVDFSFQMLRKTILATHHPYPSSYYMMLGPAGGYLIHPESSLLFKKTIFTATDSVEHPDIIALGREMTSGKTGTMHVYFDDVHCHVAYMPVMDGGWSIALVCHEDDILADYNHLTIILIIFIIVGMLVIAWITRKVVQRNIRPLNELMKATKKIAEGNYDTKILSTNHKDVVGKLQNALRNMQQALISRQESIRQNDAEIAEESAELERTLPLVEEASKRRKTFIQNVSRQFITPLNVIEGLTRVMRSSITSRRNSDASENKPSDDIGEVRAMMKYHALQLLRTTSMLYDTSDTGTAEKSRYQRTDDVTCNELAHETINYVKEQFSGAVIHFESELPDNLSIKTNRLYLMRTLREMLYNAAKYSDRQHIVLRLTQTDTTVCFIIEDVGPGLPENSKELIFMPFTKVDDLTDGLGLGLPLCKAHMEGLGGTFSYDDSYRQGCRFIAELPKEGNSTSPN